MQDPREREGEGAAGEPSGGWVSSATAWLLGIGIGVIVLVALGGAYEIGYNRGKDRATVGAVEKKAGENPKPTGENPEPTGAKPPATGPGRDLFVSNCSTCHTLAAADASGTVGPNLDDLKPDQARVEAAIANGGTGSGVMPAGLLSGKEAQEVAQYVSSSAGSG